MKLTRKRLQRETRRMLRRYKPTPVSEEEKHLLELITPATLTPSYHGKECLGNGDWPGYECQCDECPHYLECFPEFA